MSDENGKTTSDVAASMLAAGAAIAPPTMIDDTVTGGAFTVIPAGYKVEDIEKFLPAPARARGTITAETPEAFIAYYNRFCDEAVSLVFARTEDFNVTGILDWHAPGDQPGFAEHRVVYEAPRSDEWKTWTEADGKPMRQIEFAQFIEENVKDIREPAGADMLEVAQRLEAKKKVEFSSAIRISDGQREFTFNETIEGTTRKGQMKVPELFTLGIPVFLAGELYEVMARLRYRIDGGMLGLWYDLVSPDAVARDAFAAVVKEIDEGVMTDVLMASPSA